MLTGEETYTISLSGTKPTGGSVIIENNDVVGGNIQIGNYCIDLTNMTVTKGSCGVTPISNATPERCFEYEDNGDNTVTITNYLCGGQITGYNNSTWVITSHTNGEYMDVVIPNKIDGKDVTEISQFAFSSYIDDLDWNISYDKNVIINSVTIPSSVNYIKTLAFNGNLLNNIIINDYTNLRMDCAVFTSNPLNNLSDSARAEILNISDCAFSND